MNKRLIQFVFAILLLSACTRKPNSNVDPVRRPTETPAVPSFLLPVERVIVRSASYTITARDPAQALSNLQRAVEKAGGYVNSASSWSAEGSGSYASLSAKVPPESLPGLSEAINKIADQVQNQSVSVQVVTSEILKLQRRHHDLTRARDELLLFLISAKDLDRLSSFGILQELLDTELKSVENQLESQEEQSKLGTFDVTINQPASLIKPIE